MGDKASAGLKAILMMYNYIDQSHGAWPEGKRTVAALMQTARRFERSEAKDSVFALLSLMSGPVRARLVPDYTAPLAEILQSATRLSFAEGGLFCLQCISHGPGDLEAADVASWAIRADTSRAYGREATSFPRSTHRACGTLDSYHALDAGHECSQRLLVQGWLVGNVAGATRKCSREVSLDQHAFLQWVLKALKLYRRTHQMKPQTPWPFVRTLMVGDSLRAREIYHGDEQHSDRSRILSKALGEIEQALESKDDLDVASLQILSRYYNGYSGNRRFFMTNSGRPGLGPKVMQPGNFVAILASLKEPCILRSIGGGEYQFVGTAYIDGIMEGEAVEECQARGEKEPRTFTLV